jgi:hypothetical protein
MRQEAGVLARAVASSVEPYVLSLDIVPLLQQWAKPRGYTLPDDVFFAELRGRTTRELESIFGNVVVISDDEIRPLLSALASDSPLPVISMDYAFCPVGVPLNASRAVMDDMTDAGVTHRGETGDIEAQVQDIARSIQGNVILFDDVIFSGDLLTCTIIPMLHRHGIHVTSVVCGIGIGDGMRRVSECVPYVKCIRAFDDVVDEVCERDFYPGVTRSGRTVLGRENMGMPYVAPFGDPQKWASIPDAHVASFSRFCIKQTVELFAAVETASHKVVRCRDVPHFVFGIPTGDTSYVAELAKYL